MLHYGDELADHNGAVVAASENHCRGCGQGRLLETNIWIDRPTMLESTLLPNRPTFSAAAGGVGEWADLGLFFFWV